MLLAYSGLRDTTDNDGIISGKGYSDAAVYGGGDDSPQAYNGYRRYDEADSGSFSGSSNSYSDTAANNGGDDFSHTYGDNQGYDVISSASGGDSSKGFSQDSDAGLGNRGIVNNVFKSVDGVAGTIGL
ncbi:hypothetical protein MBANPS3_004764 [Mucor bainieri]